MVSTPLSLSSTLQHMGLLPMAKEELHLLMANQTIAGIPLLVLGNKSDLPDKLTVDELIDAMDLKSISGREVSCYGISAERGDEPGCRPALVGEVR